MNWQSGNQRSTRHQGKWLSWQNRPGGKNGEIVLNVVVVKDLFQVDIAAVVIVVVQDSVKTVQAQGIWEGTLVQDEIRIGQWDQVGDAEQIIDLGIGFEGHNRVGAKSSLSGVKDESLSGFGLLGLFGDLLVRAVHNLAISLAVQPTEDEVHLLGIESQQRGRGSDA